MAKDKKKRAKPAPKRKSEPKPLTDREAEAAVGGTWKDGGITASDDWESRN